MGFFDNIFGGMFDFNKDGKTDIGESFIGYNIMNEVMNDEDDDDDLLGTDWQDNCDEGYDYGIDPYDYDTPEEYQEALEEAQNEETIELSPSYEYNEKPSYEDYISAKMCYDYIETASMPDNEIKRQERAKEFQNMRRYRNYTCIDNEVDEKDKTIYTFVGVVFPETNVIYHYLTDDYSIQPGDKVIVPVGSDNEETEAEVVSVGKHLRKSAPYPVDKTKKVIKKV